MKKLLSALIIFSLILSLSACTGNSDDKESDTNSDVSDTRSPDTVDTDDVVYADTDEILNLAKNAASYSGITCVTQTQLYSVYSQKTLFTELGSYTRDTNGNILVQVMNEDGTPVSAEYLIENEHYSGAVSEGEGVKTSVSDDEKSELAESLKANNVDGLIYSLDEFSKFNAFDNEDGTFTLVASSSEESVTGKLTDVVKDIIYDEYDNCEGFSVSSVDFQYTVDETGAFKGFVIMASITVELPEETLAEDETTAVSFGNYVSYIFAAAVNEYTETISESDVDLSNVNIAENEDTVSDASAE